MFSMKLSLMYQMTLEMCHKGRWLQRTGVARSARKLGRKGVQSHTPTPSMCTCDKTRRPRDCFIRLIGKDQVDPLSYQTEGALDVVRQSSSDNPIQPVRVCKSVLRYVRP